MFSDPIVSLLVAIAIAMGTVSVLVSLIVLRGILRVRAETAELRRTFAFSNLEEERRMVVDSMDRTRTSANELKEDARRLASDASRTFAGVASLLNRTHQLEGNPHPRLTIDDIHEINDDLLTVGEGSLSNTRIAERLSETAERLEKRLKELDRRLDPDSETTDDGK